MDSRSKDLQHEYRQRFSGADKYRDQVWKILCDEYFSKFISSKDTLLDLGAGWGEFSRNISVEKKYAMDLNPDCEERVAGSALFLQQDCSERWPIENEELDVIFSSNFLEHLGNKILIEKTLDEAFRCLKPGGKIILLGPNIKYVLGDYWNYWDHLIPLTEQSLAEVLTLKGFKVTTKIDRFLPYTMSEGGRPPLMALKIYLKLKILWPLFGKQFLIIAEK